MTNQSLKYISEEDIRTKIVNSWLYSCGLTADDFSFEYSIKFRFGRTIKTFNSRADVLVRRNDGCNLLIIEVKKPNHKLGDKDRDQAIAYARSLAEGGIAPFTILTNGHDTRIFDSITKQEISGEVVPRDHPAVANDFKITGDGISARAEALEYFVTLSEDNLIAFCQSQVDYRMALLKGTDPYCGKKYIPDLYITRKDIKGELQKKLFDKEHPRQVLLVTGPPQHGKTSFVCNTADAFLNEKKPVLFYPAISLKSGLIDAIKEDFEWNFGEAYSAVHVVNRLVKILQRQNCPLIIIIDGWNEMIHNAVCLNDDIKRLNEQGIKTIISATSPSLRKLLCDHADNLSYIANAVQITNSQLRRLHSDTLQNTEEMGIIQIGNFKRDELEMGKKRYSKIYNVRFESEHDLPFNPFFLRIASEQYNNAVVPANTALAGLIGEGLTRKARRAGLGAMELTQGLDKLAQLILQYDTPLSSTLLCHVIDTDQRFYSWTESGILLAVTDSQMPFIDFYYTNEKNYSIGIVHRKWQERLLGVNPTQIKEEIELALHTTSGQTALSWFLSCPEYSMAFKAIFSSLDYFDHISPSHLKVFSDAIVNQVKFNNNLTFDWLDTYIDRLVASEHYCIESLSEITALVFSLLKSLDCEKEVGKYQLWMRLLVKIDTSLDEYGVEESYVHQFYGEDIRSYDGYNTFMDADFDVELFEQLLKEEDLIVVRNAAQYLSYACPYYFLELIPDIIRYQQDNFSQQELESVISSPCYHILAVLGDNYWGDMCPGWLSNVEKGDEEVVTEFFEQRTLWRPVLKFLHFETELYQHIFNLLSDLRDYLPDEIDPDMQLVIQDANQLLIEFPDKDKITKQTAIQDRSQKQ